jgi:ankyrin repeat protein
MSIHDAIDLHDNRAIASILSGDRNQLESRDSNNDTPLIRATRLFQADTIQLLVEEGADVNASDGQGRTALHYVAQEDEPELARMLLSHGADVNKTDNQGKNPLDWACRAAPLVAEELMRHGARVDLNCAIRLQDVDAAHRLLSTKSDLRALARSPQELLEDAVHARSSDLLDLLLSFEGHPTPLELSDSTSLLFRTIEQAMLDCDTTLFHKLLERGVRLDVTNQRGLSPLAFVNQFHATRSGHPSQMDTKNEIVRLLKFYGGLA